jgi:hypothetical protein
LLLFALTTSLMMHAGWFSDVRAQQGQFGNVNSFIVSGVSLGPYIVRTGSGAVTGVDVFNNGVSNAYLKLYNATTVSCGASAPVPLARYLIPSSSTSNGSGAVSQYTPGDRYTSGIVACVTTGIADNDTGQPAASTFNMNIHWQ